MSQIELVKAYPAKIAQDLMDGTIDMGLVPVAVIPLLKEAHMASNYCIGAEGDVASVCIFSQVPMEEIDKVYLDYQSRTSVQLARILLKHFWKKELNYIGFGGTGKQVRDILHVDDLSELIITQIKDINLFNGKMFNVGGGLKSSLSLLELTVLCQNITGNIIPVNCQIEDRIADIRVYITDNAKITDICGWQPKKTPYDIISDIYKWIVQNENELDNILN